VSNRFACVQLDLPGDLGLDEGRYLLRAGDQREEAVIVVQLLGAPTRRPRRRRPRHADPGADPPDVPLTRLTIIPAEPPEPEAVVGELERMAGDAEAAEARVVTGLRAANRVLRAHRVATGDAYGHEIGRGATLAARVGYGSGEELAEGRWERALEVPHPDPRRRRAEALRPQERLAAVLGGRESIDACETLLLRARADLDQGLSREAALQLRIGLEALLAELPLRDGGESGRQTTRRGDQADDLATLSARRESIREAAEEALRGELSEDRAGQVTETLAICERVLRRRRILSDPGD
jgi:hypothetical protein